MGRGRGAGLKKERNDGIGGEERNSTAIIWENISSHRLGI